jgi:hypothetical protein
LDGKHMAPLMQCIDGWTGVPGPFLWSSS